MKYYLYILRSVLSNKYYVGISKDPLRRLEFHNTKEKGFTSRYRPWKIVFRKKFPNKREALLAEQKVKSWKSRKMIEKVIRNEIII